MNIIDNKCVLWTSDHLAWFDVSIVEDQRVNLARCNFISIKNFAHFAAFYEVFGILEPAWYQRTLTMMTASLPFRCYVASFDVIDFKDAHVWFWNVSANQKLVVDETYRIWTGLVCAGTETRCQISDTNLKIKY